MRRLLILLALVLALGTVAACGGDDDESPTRSDASALEAQTVEAGEVTVQIEPVRIDAAGGEFKLTFDTHTVVLDLDVARSATLNVAGREWGGASWSGAGPGGHHREGTLRFAAGGPVTGSAVLSLSGLPAPVTATWTLGG